MYLNCYIFWKFPLVLQVISHPLSHSKHSHSSAYSDFSTHSSAYSLYRCRIALLESDSPLTLLQILVEYDDVEWQRREWISVHKDNVFQVFMVESSLVWCDRKDPLAGNKSTVYWPALVSNLPGSYRW